jgi:hypothetical protein
MLYFIAIACLVRESLLAKTPLQWPHSMVEVTFFESDFWVEVSDPLDFGFFLKKI